MSPLAALSYAIPLSRRRQELSPASEILPKLCGLALVNGDGRADMLFWGSSDGMLSLYLMNRPQVVGSQVLGALGLDFDFVGAEDFNGDGKADMLVRRTSDGMLVLYLMNGFEVVAAQFIARGVLIFCSWRCHSSRKRPYGSARA
jgi:FG-GAP-like repeat